MIGQNSFSNSNTNSNTTSKQTITSGELTSSGSKNKSKSSKKALLTVACVLVLVGVVIGIVFLLKQSKQGPTDNEPIATVTENNKLSISGNETDQEIAQRFEEAISSAKNEEESLNAVFSKISFEVMSGEYEIALAELNKIDSSSFNDYNQYRLHNYYATVYTNLGNTDEAAKHHTLAEEAHERDLASFTLHE